jgi:hypothetical protein
MRSDRGRDQEGICAHVLKWLPGRAVCGVRKSIPMSGRGFSHFQAVPFGVPAEVSEHFSVEGIWANPRYSLSWRFSHDLTRAWQNLMLLQAVLRQWPMTR